MPYIPAQPQELPLPAYVWMLPEQEAFCTRMSQMWELTYELGIREMASVWQNTKNYFRHWRAPHLYNLNPTLPTIAESEVTRVVLLLHGQGGGPYCFLPLAKQLQDAKIPNVYTVSLNATQSDPVPTNQLEKRIDEITSLCQARGAESVEFCLVGHSLGALVAAKYIWRKSTSPEVTLMISLAGRLRYEECRFSWFCNDVREEIEKSYQAYRADPSRALLYTCRGDLDEIVPDESAHIQSDSAREFTATGYGHGGILGAPVIHGMVASWIQQWSSTTTVRACG